MDTYTLLKYLRCTATAEEEKEVLEWLADDPDKSHAKQYEEAHFLHEWLTFHGKSFHENKAYPGTAAGKKTGRRILWIRRTVAAAASVAAVLAVAVISGLWSRNSTHHELTAQTEKVYVPAGKTMRLTLADGTTLWLNGDTEIEYPAIFPEKARNVELHHGEVLFDVAKDEERPFVVNTFAADIKVLGTKFNMTSDPETGEFTTALIRGKVSVNNRMMPEETYILMPDQMVRLENSHLQLENIEDTGAIECWTEGKIDLTGIRFDDLMRKFERAYDVRIIIEREEMPEIMYTRGKVKVSDGIEHALSMLSLAADFKYEINEDTVIIR